MSSLASAKEQTVRSMKLFSRPTVRQYFHKGLLWRGSGLQEVASYEVGPQCPLSTNSILTVQLFLDLLFVGLIGLAGDGAAEHANLTSLLVFTLEFLMGMLCHDRMLNNTNLLQAGGYGQKSRSG